MPSTSSEWKRSTPPVLRVSIDFRPWLVKGWGWLVPGAVELKDGRLIADTEHLSPIPLNEHPGLYADFADIAQPMQRRVQADFPPPEAEARALAFARAYGLSGPWNETEEGAWLPPSEADLRGLLFDAWDLREALAAWEALSREVSSWREADELIRPAERTVERLLNEIRQSLPKLRSGFDRIGANHEAEEREPRSEVGPGIVLDWHRPPPLIDILRLQLFSDLEQGYPVHECPECSKLFMRPDDAPTDRRVRSDVRFCSTRHAKRASQREWRASKPAKKKGES